MRERDGEDPKSGSFGGVLASEGHEDLKTSCRREAFPLSVAGAEDPKNGAVEDAHRKREKVKNPRTKALEVCL